jgi:gamma-glutamylcyclotransferase (GGCT)/AIG2-like uncharacterized protein YtfP
MFVTTPAISLLNMPRVEWKPLLCVPVYHRIGGRDNISFEETVLRRDRQISGMKEYLFVYGSLRSCGEVPEQIAHLVSAFRNRREATVRGRLFDFGGYCGAILDENAMTIHGEVIELPPDGKILASLDLYEEIDPADPGRSLFARNMASVRLADGSSQEAWIYVYNKPPGDAPLIESGDYHHFKKSKP